MTREEAINQLPTAWSANRQLARNIVALVQPQVIVDLGVDWGYSSFVFADAAPDSRVYAVDWFQGDQHAGFRNTFETVSHIRDTFRFDNLTLIVGDFAQVASMWNRRIDILHIDGEHTYEAVSANYADWIKFVNDDGVILLHDTVSFPDTVGRFFNEVELPRFNYDADNGLGIISRNADLVEQIRTVSRAV